jgi:hypothetical protein
LPALEEWAVLVSWIDTFIWDLLDSRWDGLCAGGGLLRLPAAAFALRGFHKVWGVRMEKASVDRHTSL